MHKINDVIFSIYYCILGTEFRLVKKSDENSIKIYDRKGPLFPNPRGERLIKFVEQYYDWRKDKR